MSHFAELEVEYDQKNESEFVAALEKQFGSGKVEVHEQPVGLMGVEGKDRSRLSSINADYAPECHIIIRRKDVGSMANDIGFRRTENGKYSAYISQWDKGHNFAPSRQGLVMQEYALLTAEKTLRAGGYSTTRQAQDGGSVQVIGSKWG